MNFGKVLIEHTTSLIPDAPDGEPTVPDITVHERRAFGYKKAIGLKTRHRTAPVEAGATCTFN